MAAAEAAEAAESAVWQPLPTCLPTFPTHGRSRPAIGPPRRCFCGRGSQVRPTGGLFGTLCDWRRRLPATVYLQHIHHDEPALMYRRAFKPAVVALVLGQT